MILLVILPVEGGVWNIRLTSVLGNASGKFQYGFQRVLANENA